MPQDNDILQNSEALPAPTGEPLSERDIALRALGAQSHASQHQPESASATAEAQAGDTVAHLQRRATIPPLDTPGHIHTGGHPDPTTGETVHTVTTLPPRPEN